VEIRSSHQPAIILVSEAAMSTQPKTLLTPEEYLAMEREAEYKSEYYDGVMYAMAGARAAHDLIAGNTHGQLWNAFRSRPCRAHTSDMRVRTVARHYAYPDTSALCGEPRFLDERHDTLLNPGMIVEVLSPSTEAYDRGRKFELYQSISSLREYLLLASDRVHADLYTRQANGLWLLSSAGGLDDVLTFESVGCEIKLADLYEKVEFDVTQQRPA
jgi:Uma2 family endonuclease